MSTFHFVGCHVMWREVCHFASISSHVFTFHFLEQGLHNTPDVLRERLQEAVDAAPEACDAVLVGYGLCCNGVEGVSARKVPLVIPRAHDCITFLLGSKERYRQLFDARPGTYWYSPGWIDTGTQPGKTRYESLLAQYIEKYGEDNGAYLMEATEGWMDKYDTAAYVDLGFHDSEEYRRYTHECAEYLGWKCEILEGDPGLVRNMVDGKWNEDVFLVVSPGQAIAASHDDTILTVKCHKSASL